MALKNLSLFPENGILQRERERNCTQGIVYGVYCSVRYRQTSQPLKYLALATPVICLTAVGPDPTSTQITMDEILVQLKSMRVLPLTSMGTRFPPWQF